MQHPEGVRGVDLGDVEAPVGDRIQDLYVRHAPAAFRLAILLTGDRQLAEDCVQDAFVKVIGRLGHLRSGEAFDAYLRRTVVNLVNNRWRRRSLERRHERPEVPRLVAPADAALVERLTVWEAIRGLPTRQRTAIVLRFYEDLKEADIAAVMRCSEGTARSLVSRGMASLRARLGGDDDA
jgi:RNA polymerase sigma-70 factor (sigma-E family)